MATLTRVERKLLVKAILQFKPYKTDYLPENGKFIPFIPTRDKEAVSDDRVIEVAEDLREYGFKPENVLPNKFKAVEGEAESGDAARMSAAEAASAAFEGGNTTLVELAKKAIRKADSAMEQAKKAMAGVDVDAVKELARKEAALYVNEKGGVTNRIEIKSGDKVTVVEGDLYHKQLPLVLRLAQCRDREGNLPNIMLFGGAGVGKSRIARAVAATMGLEFYQHNAVTYEHQMMGSVNPLNGNYTLTPLMVAYECGGVVLLDENDRSENDALLPFNGGLADGEVARPDGKRVPRHKDCLIICTANTKGQGADREYVGANKLDAAYLDRFGFKIEIVRDEALEAALIGDPDVMSRIEKLRNTITYYGVDYDVTTRAAKSISDAVRGGLTVEEAMDCVVFNMLTSDQEKLIKENM